MSGYSYEIAHWTASEAVKKDLGITKEIVEVMKSKTPLPYVSFALLSTPLMKPRIQDLWRYQS